MTATQDLTARAMAALAEKETCQATNISHYTWGALVKCVLPAGHALSRINHRGEEADGSMREWDY